MCSSVEKTNCDILTSPMARSMAITAAKEIETLKQALQEKQNKLLAMETVYMQESERQAELEDGLIAWQDKYDRLYECYKRVQKVNQSLEDKLLKMVDRNAGERAQLTSDVATLSVRLAQANFNIAKLQREIDRYKTDINLAIKLLQCKPDSFLPQKVSSLPLDMQSKVTAYMRLETTSDSEGSVTGGSVNAITTATSTSMTTITTTTKTTTTTTIAAAAPATAAYKVLPVSHSPPPDPCPFPPTAMVYSMRGLDAKPNDDTRLSVKDNHNKNNDKNDYYQHQLDDNDDNNEVINKNRKIYNGNNGNGNNNINRNSNVHNNNYDGDNDDDNNDGVMHNYRMSLNDKQQNSILKNNNDMITPVIVARYLEDELKAGEMKHCDTCQCSKDLTVLADLCRSYTVATQTSFTTYSKPTVNSDGNLNDSLHNPAQLCLRCYSNLNSPSRTNSPFTNKNLLKSTDSVISETKSSLSDLNENDKLFVSVKRDDLKVNPILGHHRLLTDRMALTAAATGKQQQQKSSFTVLIDSNKKGIATTGLHRQHRFLDRGGTVMDILEDNGTLNQIIKDIKKTRKNFNCNEDLEEESKPLLSSTLSHSNSELEADTATTTLMSCEQNERLIKSPAFSNCSGTRFAVKSPPVNGLLEQSNNGDSVNSLWSRSSSIEGAKMFENFNRNLIKAIKAENPIHRGPRLCAMRIQSNGQSNVLLNNMEMMEDAVTPIIYKRRERLLDEELEDGREVITSMTTRQNLTSSNNTSPPMDTNSNGKDVKNNQNNELNASTNNSANNEAGGGTIGDGLELLTNSLTESGQRTICEIKSDEKTLNCNIPPTTVMSTIGFDNNSKDSSHTLSSSLSETNDFQENIILRRQQLHRVAEWVQNNTQQMEREQQEQQRQLKDQTVNVMTACDSSGTDQPSSFSTIDQFDSVSVEKLSLDSGYKTTPQVNATTGGSPDDTIKTSDESLSPQSGEIYATAKCPSSNEVSTTTPPQTYYRRTSRSGLPVAYTTTAVNVDVSATTANPHDNPDSNSQLSHTVPDQPTCDILNYKYYPNDSDKTRAIKAELHTTTQNVDIAQMEYNVKQFLLKQNEWSMRSIHAAAHDVSRVQSNAQTTTTSIKARNSLRHIKLFNNTNLGPGVGERVHTNVTSSSSTTNTTIKAKTIKASNTVNKPSLVVNAIRPITSLTTIQTAGGISNSGVGVGGVAGGLTTGLTSTSSIHLRTETNL